MFEVQGKLADIGLVSVASGNVRWEGDHIRVVLKPKDSRGITKEVVTRISAYVRNIGCRCVFDQVQQQQVQLHVQWDLSLYLVMVTYVLTSVLM